MTEKKLKKKLIVTTQQDGLNEAELVQDSKDKVKAQVDNPTIVPDIKPVPDDVQLIITGVETNISKRNGLKQQIKDTTVDITSGLTSLKNIFVDKWAPQIQDAVGDDVGKVKLLKFYVKGIDDGHAEPQVNVTNSHAIIVEIDLNSPLVHTLSIINSVTGKIGLPPDALYIDVYEFFGDNAPASYKQMTHLGRARRGKFSNHFTPEQLGLKVWYYVVYAPRDAGVIPEIGVMVSAKVV